MAENEERRTRISAVLVIGILLMSASIGSHAQECFQQAPSLENGADPFAPIASTRLSKDDRKAVEKLFRNVKGRWTGDAEGYFCRGNKESLRKEADNYRIAMEATTDGSEELLITSELNSKTKKTTRTEKLRLFVSNDSLRVNHNDRGGEVKILQMSRSGDAIEFIHKVVVSTDTGAIDFTEIVRRIQVSATRLSIVYDVYLRGGLTSSGTWKLAKN